jgi:hypothetical protein
MQHHASHLVAAPVHVQGSGILCIVRVHLHRPQVGWQPQRDSSTWNVLQHTPVQGCAVLTNCLNAPAGKGTRVIPAPPAPAAAALQRDGPARAPPAQHKCIAVQP